MVKGGHDAEMLRLQDHGSRDLDWTVRAILQNKQDTGNTGKKREGRLAFAALWEI
jgi:hypothetical protein